jgi:hypothetical protein
MSQEWAQETAEALEQAAQSALQKAKELGLLKEKE